MHVLPGHEPVGVQHLVQVVAGLQRGRALLVVARPEAAHDLAARALDGGGREHSLGGAADAPQEVHRRALGHRHERGRHVTVRDEPDARAGGADLGHRLVVAGAVEHDHHDVPHRHALLLRHQLQRLGEGPVEVEQVGHVARRGHLQHVDAGARIEHRPPLRQGDGGDGVGETLGAQLRALERVHGDIHLGRRAVADPLAVVEHRRLVLLALADHHHAVHRHGLEHQAHGVHRGAVGQLLLAPPDPAGAGQRRVLGGTHELHGEVAVRAHRSVAGRRSGGLLHAQITPGGLRTSV